MATLYIRRKPKWINYVDSVEDIQFLDGIVVKPMVIGDYSIFSKSMQSSLLKVLEENPLISLYSSTDVTDSVLLSRFTEVEKESIKISSEGNNLNDFFESPQSYGDCVRNLAALGNKTKIIVPYLTTNKIVKCIFSWQT